MFLQCTGGAWLPWLTWVTGWKGRATCHLVCNIVVYLYTTSRNGRYLGSVLVASWSDDSWAQLAARPRPAGRLQTSTTSLVAGTEPLRSTVYIAGEACIALQHPFRTPNESIL